MRPNPRRRGAALVEALVVLSVFIASFFGIVYFRDLYLVKMRTQRLARAAALAHAMSACKTDVNAAIASDLPKEKKLNQASLQVPPRPTDPNLPEPQSKAGKALDGVASKRGGTALNRVDGAELAGSAKATSKPDPVTAEKGFRGTVLSGSYASCGDDLTDEQYTAIAKEIPSFLGF